MERNELQKSFYQPDIIYKFIFEDNGIIKTIRGHVLLEEEFLVTIKAVETDDVVILGKRWLVKVTKSRTDN